MPFTPDKPASSFKPDNKVTSSNPQNPSYMQMPKDTGYTPGGTPASQALADPEGNARNAAIGTGMAVGGLGAAASEGLTGAAGVAARIGTNIASGASQGGVDPNGSATRGAIAGGVTGVASEGLGYLLGKAKDGVNYISRKAATMNAPQAAAYQADPEGVTSMAGMLDDPKQLPDLQDQAVGAINKTRASLKGQGLQNSGQLRQLLTGKQVQIDPDMVGGLNPEVDEMLDIARRRNAPDMDAMQAFKETASGGPSGPITVDANDARKMKQILGDQANFAQGSITDPVQAASNAAAGKASGQINGTLRGIDPKVGELSSEMQDGMNLQKVLRTGAKNNPLAFVSSESNDKLANLARADEAGGGGLLDFGNKYGAAKTIANKDNDDMISRLGIKTAGRAGLRATQTATDAAKAAPSSSDLRSILQGLFSGN